MKKTELFKLVKQSLKEVVNEQIKGEAQRLTNKNRYNQLKTLPKLTPTLKESKEALKNRKLLTEMPMSSGADSCPSGGTDYGFLRVYSGDCGASGVTYEDFNDGFICCSSNNWEEENGDDPWDYVDTEWGGYDIIDGDSFGGQGGGDECYCPNPNIDSSGVLQDCGISNNQFDQTDLDFFLTSMGAGNLMSYNQFPGTLGQGNNFGDECAGCYHIDAANDGMSTSNTQHGVGASNTLFGCPNGTVYPTDVTGRDNITCCDFVVDCATGEVPGYTDGISLSTSINISPTNESQITTTGPSPITHDWDTAGVFGSITEDPLHLCRFSGCDDNGLNGSALATNYLSVLYGPGASYNSGAPIIVDDGSCIASVDGCTDDGSDPNGNSPVPGIAACNYYPDATVDDGTCQYTTCAGCMDDGTGGVDGAGNSIEPAAGRPVGFTGNACTYDANITISDPDSAISNGNPACEYGTCSGCMDDGTNNPGTDRANFTYFTAGIPACNNQVGGPFSSSNPDACEYDTCAGCTDLTSCSPNSGCTGTCVVDDGSCGYACYGCDQPGMNGDAAGTPISIFSAAYSINNTIDMGTTPPTPTAPPATPCAYTGCLSKDDGAGTAYSNYVCTIHWEVCISGTGAACGSPCPTGDIDPTLGAFSDDGSCTEVDIQGCMDPADCSYDPLANTGDQSIGDGGVSLPGLCLGVKGICEICGTSGPEPDPTCGCTNAIACNFNPTAVTSGDNPVPFSNCTVPTNCQECVSLPSPTNTDGVQASDACVGCTDNTACNYGWNVLGNHIDPGTTGFLFVDWTDDGSCVVPGANCQRCIDLLPPEQNSSPWTEQDPACDGCASFSTTACNYDPVASTDPIINPDYINACVVPGVCEKCVTTPSPTNTDGVEIDPLCGCMDGGSTEYTSILGDGPDGFIATNYNLLGPNGTGAVSIFTTDPGPGYTFTNDGFESCEYAFGCTNVLACNYDVLAVNDNGTCTIPGFCEVCVDPTQGPSNTSGIQHDPDCGCIDPVATNYDPNASTQGTALSDICTYELGCMDDTYCNYDSGATQDDGSCQNQFDPSQCEICDGPQGPTNLSAPVHNYNNINCYSCINDTDACNYNTNALATAQDDGLCVVPVFCELCSNTNQQPGNTGLIHDPICGCIDGVANNYDSNASQQGPSSPLLTSQGAAPNDCSYNLGCMDDTYCNYDSGATQDDGSCANQFDPQQCTMCNGVQGPGNLDPVIHDTNNINCFSCLDSTACNNNTGALAAAIDDGSCVIPGFCEICAGAPAPGNTTPVHDPDCGCTDPVATNYCSTCGTQGTAAGDLCTYVLGCMDATACNYDSGATQDDGSCNTPPGTCEVCDGPQGASNTNAPVTDPACVCHTVTAHRCNMDDTIVDFECMVIGGDEPLVGDEFRVTTHIKTMAEQIGQSDMMKSKYQEKAPMGSSKIYIVDTVSTSISPSHAPVKNFPADTCEEMQWQCFCHPHQHPTSGQGWPGHSHGCKLTTDAANGTHTFDNLGDCQNICSGVQANYPFNAYKPDHWLGDGTSNASDYESLWTGTNPGGGEGCTDGNAINYDPQAYIDDGSCIYTQGGGNTCFTGDTLITMPDNTTRRIDDLKVDEIVKSEKETSQIQSIDVHEGEFDLYSINGSKHFVTEDHPFQTTEGWKAIIPDKTRENHQIEAFVLKVGDVLIKDNGETEEILTLEKSEEKISTTTYNLRLDNEHVYYADNYLVHNGGVRRNIPLGEAENEFEGGGKVGKGGGGNPGGGPGYICAKSTNGQAVNHPSCLFGQMPYGHLGCCLPPNTPCPPGSTCGGANSCFTLGGSQGSCSNGTLNEGLKEVKESKKLRDSFKNEFFPSSKLSNKKLRETIKKIIKNKNK